jgi:hypothetical protein
MQALSAVAQPQPWHHYSSAVASQSLVQQEAYQLLPARGVQARQQALPTTSSAGLPSSFAPSCSLATYLDTLCVREYLCTFSQLPRAMRPCLLQLAVSDIAELLLGA